MKQKLVIFDVDGTLFDGSIGVEFVKALVKNEIFNKEISDEIFAWYGKYKSDQVDKSVAMDEIYKLCAIGMSGSDISSIQKIALDTYYSVSNMIFDFSRPLVELFRKNGYETILLSGSPIEVVRLLGDNFGIKSNNIIAGQLENENGVYNGKIILYPGSSEQKVELIDKYILDNNLDVDWVHSVGMGDDERDLGILERVGLPVAIEPNDWLNKKAIKNNYKIVDRTNVIEVVSSLI